MKGKKTVAETEYEWGHKDGIHRATDPTIAEGITRCVNCDPAYLRGLIAGLSSVLAQHQERKAKRLARKLKLVG